MYCLLMEREEFSGTSERVCFPFLGHVELLLGF